MEFIHAAKFIQEWFDRLPLETKAWLAQAYWVLLPLVILLIIYIVIRAEQVSESGKVLVQWYHPKHWLARYLQIKAENEAKFASENAGFYNKTQQFLEFSRQASDIVYDILFVILGLLGFVGVLFSLVMNPLKTWWMFIPCVIAAYIGVRSLRGLLNKTQKNSEL